MSPATGAPAEGYIVKTASDGAPVAYVDHGGSGQITVPAGDLPIRLVVQAVNPDG